MNLHFKPIETNAAIARQTDYIRHLALTPQIASDYSFVNLYGWASEHFLEWAWDDNLIWIKQTQPQVVYWAPVGPWDQINWKTKFDSILNGPSNFIRIPERLVEIWQAQLNGQLQISEARGHWDYLYNAENLIALRGNRYHKKKNLVNQFRRKYEFEYMPLEPALIGKALAMQDDWCTWRDCESSETLTAENRSIERVLKAWDKLAGVIGGTILFDNQMVAYTVAETLTDDMLLIHFEKANQDFKGAYQAINQMFLAHTGKEYSLINREQDLGDEGLRKAKMSYHPVDFLKKSAMVITPPV